LALFTDPIQIYKIFNVIKLIDIHKTYRVNNSEFTALNGINLNIKAGDIFGIIGHSGAGKSTLLRMINRLEEPTSGKVFINDVDITSLSYGQMLEQRRKVGMIFQHFNLLSSKTVFNNIALPLRLAGTYSKSHITNKVSELLDRVGLSSQANHYPAQLSGGQKQRVGIARALATEPQILLCDEATSALDPQTTAQVLRLLAQINQELKLTIVLITHEMSVIRRICDQVAVLDKGCLVEQGKVVDVFLHPKQAKTRSFILEDEHENEEDQLSDFAHVVGTIVRLTFQGEATYQPLLQEVVYETNISYSILKGRIDRIKDTPYGQLVVALNGSNVAAALSSFTQKGLHLEVLR